MEQVKIKIGPITFDHAETRAALHFERDDFHDFPRFKREAVGWALRASACRRAHANEAQCPRGSARLYRVGKIARKPDAG